MKLNLALGMLLSSSSVFAARDALHTLFEEERATILAEYPLDASYEGVKDFDDRLDSSLPSDFKRRLSLDHQFLASLKNIDRSSLSVDDQVSYDLFAFMLKARIMRATYKEWRIPLTNDEGFHTSILRLHEVADTSNADGYKRYIKRLLDVPRFFEENMANMRQGLKDGFTLSAEILPGIKAGLAASQFKNPEDCPLFEPFKKFPTSISAKAQTQLKEAGRAAIATAVLPSLRKFEEFFDGEYSAGARKTIGASELPQGKTYYRDLVKNYATMEIGPDEVHELGLKEVARIRAEMKTTMVKTGFNGDLSEFLAFLRSDSQFYETTALGLLKSATYLAKEIDGKLPLFFGKLPRMTYRVEPVPESLAQNYTTGRYNPGPDDGKTPGTYLVNTFATNKRPLYALPALTLHEAVPGHHLQVALARELSDAPKFRRTFYVDAFGEGWGLYAEKLGVEMGIFKTPYEDFGRLSYEMWRACRLVVDTGMHWKGWSRTQVMDYLKANTALPDHEVETETDRYISWPGQALSYKIGEMKILELRKKAEKALGDKFDLRAFHDAVLDQGTMTLTMLERQIDAFIARWASK